MSDAKETLDWERIHHQMEAHLQAMDDALVFDKQRVQHRLRQRAEELSRRGTDERHTKPLRRVLVFTLGDQRFAFDLALVTKVARLDKYVRVPGGPPELLGVANVDGEVHSVLNLRPSLGVDFSGDERPAYVFLLHWGTAEFGVAADAIEEVANFRDDEIRHPTDDATTALESSTGIGPNATVLLDANKLFERAFGTHSAA